MHLSNEALQTLIQIAGVGTLVLAAGSPLIPRALKWREKLAALDPLLRRLFWVYAAYILGTNVALGLVSLLAADALVQAGPLALAVNSYAAVYWGARVAIQFACFQDVKPEEIGYRGAEVVLVALFVYSTAVYALAALSGSGVWG
jgi:hypothetical protein